MMRTPSIFVFIIFIVLIFVLIIRFSKIIPSFFVDKGSCIRQFESEFSLHSLAPLFPIKKGFFRKPTNPPLTLREGPPLPQAPFPSGYRGCTNRPTRCSNRFAIRLADHQRSRQKGYAGWDRLAMLVAYKQLQTYLVLLQL